MKEKKYILGLISVGIVVLGAIFKVNHWPAAGILITFGTLLILFAFLPIALISNYRIERNRAYLPLYYTTWITCLVVMIGMLFKIMHWPATGIIVTISLPFPFVVFLPVYLYVTSKTKNYNIYNMVFVLILLAVQAMFAAILALNVSKERLDDSLVFAGNYNRVETALEFVELTDGGNNHQIVAEIDATLKIVDECRSLLFNAIGISDSNWGADPAMTPYLDNKGYGTYLMLYSDENAPGIRLEKSLANLSKNIMANKDNSALSKTYGSIFNYSPEDLDGISWSGMVFGDTYLTWVLNYLDELELNLLFVKATIV